LEVVEYLVGKGTDWNANDKTQSNALHYAALGIQGERNRAVVEYFIEELKAYYRSLVNNEFNLLHLAVRAANVSLAEYIVQKFPGLVSENTCSASPFDMAHLLQEWTIRVVQFSGKREDFEPWFEKFKARGKRRGYKDHYLKKAGDIPKTTYDIDNNTSKSDDEKALQKLKEDNENAFHELLLSMDTSTVEDKLAFKLAMSSKTTDYKDGHAGNLVEKLIKKFMPKTAPTLVKLHKEFYSSNRRS
jgi:Ankyrin repeats (3 copies)